MPDLLASGLGWLGGQRRKHRSIAVTYRRGTESVELPATIGRSRFEETDAYGVIMCWLGVNRTLVNGKIRLGIRVSTAHGRSP